MKIAIFGGSFDPVHKEHIELVKAAISTLSLDKVLIMPAFAPPHKKGKKLAEDTHRLQMCRLAFKGLEQVEICDYEIAQKGMSYTYLTCEYFHSLYNGAQLYFLVGTDMLRDFPTWKYPEKILNCATLAVCARDESEGWLASERALFKEKFGCDFAVIDYNASPVSSTEIRVLAGAGVRVNALTSEEVANYIEQNALYSIPNASLALSLEKPSRKEHSLRVAMAAAKRALALGVEERKAIAACLFHDCAKNLPPESEYLQGFVLEKKFGKVPPAVLHQFQGAFVAQKYFGVQEQDILNAIRFHTSGRPNMSELEKLVFLADMVEEGREYKGVENLRKLFYAEEKKGVGGLDFCLATALKETVDYLEIKGGEIYPLTKSAFEFYKNNLEK